MYVDGIMLLYYYYYYYYYYVIMLCMSTACGRPQMGRWLISCGFMGTGGKN